MQRPLNTHPNDNNSVEYETDELETLQGLHVRTTDSPSSEADAGLIDATRDVTTPTDDVFDRDNTAMELPMADVDIEPETLHMPVMSDMDAPGEIDIEELDDETVEAALPPDARLDPKEP